MNVEILGAGLWARGLTGMADLQALLSQTGQTIEGAFVAPKPAAIPPRERRRAGLLINLAVEVAHQACEQAGVDKTQIPSVFTSAMGDTAITDYMCRKLSGDEKLLSPTKFHNSVHNAPSGYWSISAENRAPSTFVGGYVHSFGTALLESASVACSHCAPVLLVAYDIATNVPFDAVHGIQEHLGLALVLAPAGMADADGTGIAASAGTGVLGAYELGFAPLEGSSAVSSLPVAPQLRALAESNPMGCALSLLEQLADGRPAQRLRFAAAPGALIELNPRQES